MRTVETPNKTRGYVRWADASWRDEARQEHLDRLAAVRAAPACASDTMSVPNGLMIPRPAACPKRRMPKLT